MGIHYPIGTEKLSFVFENIEPYIYGYKKKKNIYRNFIETNYSGYKVIHSCDLYKDKYNTTIYDILKVNYFKDNLIGEYYENCKNSIVLPLYYLKQDSTKQLITHLKFKNFSFDSDITKVDLSDNILYGSNYVDEFNYYRFANMLNFRLIFKNNGFEYLYCVDKENELIRVDKPIFEEMICFV